MKKAPKKKAEKEVTDVTMLQIIPKTRRGGQNSKTSETRMKFLKAYEQSYGNISASCEFAGISRLTFYRWMKSKSRVNLKFQERVNLLRPADGQVDLAEAVVFAHLKVFNLRAAELVLLKTKAGKNRGYGESKSDLEFELVLRAVARLEKVITSQIQRDPSFKPDVKKFAEVAAEDFGVKPEDVEKEFLKRQPQMIEGIQ